MGGIYVLIIRFKRKIKICVGKLGPVLFTEGLYFYVGKALGSLESRIERHLQRNKKNFWHIDYLLEYSEILGIM